MKDIWSSLLTGKYYAVMYCVSPFILWPIVLTVDGSVTEVLLSYKSKKLNWIFPSCSFVLKSTALNVKYDRCVILIKLNDLYRTPLLLQTFSSANATPEFEGRGGEGLGIELSNTLVKVFSNKHCLDLKSLCISPGENCWVLYVDVLVSKTVGVSQVLQLVGPCFLMFLKA